MDNSIRRDFSVTIGDSDGSNSFDPSIQWFGFAKDSFEDLGKHELTVSVNDEDIVSFTNITTPGLMPWWMKSTN